MQEIFKRTAGFPAIFAFGSLLMDVPGAVNTSG
jgi:hypothetical protein